MSVRQNSLTILICKTINSLEQNWEINLFMILDQCFHDQFSSDLTGQFLRSQLSNNAIAIIYI